MKMGLLHAGLLFLLFPSVFCDHLWGDDGETAYERGRESERDSGAEAGREKKEAPAAPRSRHWKSSSGAIRYPEFVIVSENQTQLFKPEKGFRPLPESAKKLLLRPKSTKLPAGGSDKSKSVEVLCHVDRLYVRVKRSLFSTRDAFKHLRLGSCPVNQITKDHYNLLYPLGFNCGFKMKSVRDFLIIGIGLSYNPATAVVREMPFDIKLQCQFPRFFHSYKIGFDPKLQGGTVYRQLQSKNMFALVPQDESGNDVTSLRTYTLGQPMVFQTRGPDRTSNHGNQRLYIHKCFTTTSANPNTNSKYTVIDNQGCMIDSNVTQLSKFVQSNSRKTQKFQVAAFIFKQSASSSQRLYMHCQVVFGPPTPTRSFKACTYCPVEKRWKELYGSHSVCTCCESTCPSAQPRASEALVSSHSWKVEKAQSSSSDGDEDDEDYEEVNPTEPPDSDRTGHEEPSEMDHSDFLKHWDQQY